MKQNQGASKRKVPVIAIFDIGKTNKKIFLFSEEYKIVYERAVQLPETRDEDGFPCEDLDALTRWVKEEIRLARSLEEVTIKAINVSAYGASFAHIDHQGKPIGHLSNYLKPYPEALLHTFISTYDQDHALSLQTASPQLGSLNSGLQLYRLKQEKPSSYNQIKYSLHLPQYISFLLTGKSFAELTSIGCHTMLWDFKNKNYHSWVAKENMDSKFPELVSCDYITIDGDAQIGIGLHDSSAALIPYLKYFRDPFVLLSTGTWCISLNPFNHSPLTTEELESDCLQYLSYKGQPVKASRLFSGHEHELMLKKIASHFSVRTERLRAVEFDKEIASSLINTRSGISPGSLSAGQQSSAFHERNLSQFKSAEEAYHELIIDIVRQQVASTSLVLKNSNAKKIYVDGGFSTNSVYMNLLAAGFPQFEIYKANIPQASAFGAALAIHQTWNHYPVPPEIVKLSLVNRPDGIHIH